VGTFVPGSHGSEAILLSQAAANIIAYIQQQTHETTEKILENAGATLDDNDIELLKDLARLQGTGGTSTSGGAGGTTPGGGQ
jgi:hypothetical protein